MYYCRILYYLYVVCLSFAAERQSARMSKITNDGLTRSDTRCFTAVLIWQQWASKDQWRIKMYYFLLKRRLDGQRDRKITAWT